MKFKGLAIVALSAWMLSVAWYDKVEGPPIRFACYVGITVGVYLFFEGLKREIIAALTPDRRDGNSPVNRPAPRPPEDPRGPA